MKWVQNSQSIINFDVVELLIIFQTIQKIIEVHLNKFSIKRNTGTLVGRLVYTVLDWTRIYLDGLWSKLIISLFLSLFFFFSFFSIRVYFHGHSRITGQQGKVESNSLTPVYHFQQLHWHLDISRTIAAHSL